MFPEALKVFYLFRFIFNKKNWTFLYLYQANLLLNSILFLYVLEHFPSKMDIKYLPECEYFYKLSVCSYIQGQFVK